MVFLVVLTGPIASGKSTVARVLEDRGAHIIDADQLAREVVAAGSAGLAAIVSEFGEEFLAADGGLDRAALAKLIFNDPEARQRLNALTHPAVHALLAERLAEIETAAPYAVVVYDVPLFEASAKARLSPQLVVAVTAPSKMRLSRLTQLRELDPSEASARIAAQPNNEHYLELADTSIDTSGTVAGTVAAAEALWDTITQRNSSKLS